MAQGVRIERDEGILVLRFDRADKKNAITAHMYAALAAALEEADRDPAVGACAFLGAPGVFTAGNDIADFARISEGGGLGEEIMRFLRALATSARPLLAGVDGLAVGLGTTLLLHCDYVLATPRTVFRTPFTALGVVPEAGSSLLAPRRMGHARAFELLVMGRDLGAEGAKAAGLVNGIASPDEIEEAVMAAARDLLSRPRGAVLAARRLLKGDPAEVLGQIEAEAAVFGERLQSPESRAAFAAFLGKGKA